MKLYYKPGSCSLAAHIVLNEAGARYDLEKVDLATKTTESGADYRRVNPRGYVPALQLDDGAVITENAAILQYLGDAFGSAALVPPAGTMARVRLQEVLGFLTAELHKSFSPFFAGPLEPAQRAAAQQRLALQLDRFESFLPKDGPYLLGQAVSVADFYAFVVLNWTNVIGVSLEDRPAVCAYMALLRARPAVQQTLAQEGLPA